MSKRSKDWVDILLEHGIDVSGKTIFLNDSIDRDSLNQIILGIHLIGGDQNITLLLNSGGGDLSAGLGIYDALRECTGTITGRVVGEACSAACILLQACDIREASPNSTIMHHVGEASIDTHAENFRLFSEFYKRQLDKVDEIMLNRINYTRTTRGDKELTMKKWKDINRFDSWLFPEEAVELGLLDRIH